MPRPTFTCRNTLERLRESYDEKQGKEEDTQTMKIARVEYTVKVTGEDGKIVSMNKERILPELDAIDPESIQKLLEQEEQATGQPGHGKNIPGSCLIVTNITELKPTGDDDQM